MTLPRGPAMFEIPDTDNLGQFSAAGLTDLSRQAKTEYDTLLASLTADTATDEQLDYVESLQELYQVTLPEELASRKSRRDRFSALTAEPEDDPEEESAEELETVTASATTTNSNTTIQVKLSDIVDKAPAPEMPVASRTGFATLVAAAGVPNYDAGQPLTTMLDVAKAFEARSASHGVRANRPGTKLEPVTYPVAQLVRDYPDEFSVNGDQTDYAKLLEVINEKRLPGGSLLRSVEARMKELQANDPTRDSLVAAMGWCAPSETDYSICLQISTDGLADFPEVQARRGGIRHNTGIEFDSIFGGGSCASPTGFFDLTEAQVAAGTIKTCLEIPCPDFVDTRLGVTGLCLTGNILAIRGYPEFTATFTRGALAASAHQVNRE